MTSVEGVIGIEYDPHPYIPQCGPDSLLWVRGLTTHALREADVSTAVCLLYCEVLQSTFEISIRMSCQSDQNTQN